jgi:anti-anti-sigma factor
VIRARGAPSIEEDRSVEIETRQFADAAVVRPHGRIDHMSAAAFEAVIAPLVAQAAARRGAVVLDFSEVAYISSVGLRVLMVAAKQMREHQALLLIGGLQSLVVEIFTISRFDRVLAVVPTTDDALARCSPAALAAWRAQGHGGAA